MIYKSKLKIIKNNKKNVKKSTKIRFINNTTVNNKVIQTRN
jgi:hypothetical protein